MSINSHVVKSTVVGALGGLLFGFDTAVISGTTSALTRTYHLTPGYARRHCFERAGRHGHRRHGRRHSRTEVRTPRQSSRHGHLLCPLRDRLRARLELARAHRLSLHRRTRHRWLVRSRPDVYRGDLTARLARPPGRLLPGEYRRRHPARLHLQRLHRQQAPRRE